MNKSNLFKLALFSIMIGATSISLAVPVVNGDQSNTQVQNQSDNQSDQTLATSQNPYPIPAPNPAPIPKSSYTPILRTTPTLPQINQGQQPNAIPAPQTGQNPQSYQTQLPPQPSPQRSNLRRDERSEFWDNRYQTHRVRPISNWVMIPNYTNIPETAVIGNELSNNYYYVCQAYYQGSLIPGKLIAGNCNITNNGQEIVISNYRLLSGRGYQWEPAIPGTIPNGAVIGGYESNGQPLYVCRAQYRGEMHPGKIINNRCDFGFGGQERSATYYEVLVY